MSQFHYRIGKQEAVLKRNLIQTLDNPSTGHCIKSQRIGSYCCRSDALHYLLQIERLIASGLFESWHRIGKWLVRGNWRW